MLFSLSLGQGQGLEAGDVGCLIVATLPVGGQVGSEQVSWAGTCESGAAAPSAAQMALWLW